MTVTVRPLLAGEIEAALPALGRLRIAVFREWPYLYEGSEAYERDYVRAAVALGAGPLRIMARHILPNVVSPIIVATTLSVGYVILTESVLSFLGLGIQPRCRAGATC